MGSRRSFGYAARMRLQRLFFLPILALFVACGPGNEADKVGVGAECSVAADCPVIMCDTEPCPDLQCLTQFAGGYCGLTACTADADCPMGSACVTHTDSMNYCFRLCVDKAECNLNRSPAVESNCSANVDFVEPQSAKACVPPSSGI